MMPYLPTSTHFDMQREVMDGGSHYSKARAREERPDPLGLAWIALLNKLQTLLGARPRSTGRTGVRKPGSIDPHTRFQVEVYVHPA